MRTAAWALLLIFVFAIPWEYSLDLGHPLGNAARIAGLLVLLAAIPAMLQAGRMRTPGAFWWFTLALYLWLCCSYLWTIDAAATLARMRGYFQEIMIVWLVWEFADSPADLRSLLRATVGGSWVLAILTIAAFHSPEAIAAGQIRFVAYGQDANEVARFLDLGFPLAALLVNCERRLAWRLMALGFLPLGLVAVLLTASRGGFIAAIVALGGSAALLARGHARRVVAAVLALPPFLAALWFIIPSGTLGRVATIPEQLRGGDLNQRLNIWSAGWRAFTQATCCALGVSNARPAAVGAVDSAHCVGCNVASRDCRGESHDVAAFRGDCDCRAAGEGGSTRARQILLRSARVLFVPQGALQAWGEGATDDVLPQKWPGAADLWLERTASERKKTEWLAAQIDILRLGS